MTPEEETLEKIKYVLSFGNDAQAIRLIEQYGHWKQEQTKQCAINGVGKQSKLLKVAYEPKIKELQNQLTEANQEYANGKLTEVKWIRHTAFLKGNINALLNL